MFEVSTNWLNGAGQVAVYALAISGGLWLLSKIQMKERGQEMKNYKCTDCKKFYNINKGTYDPEWGFHCIYCGGLEEVGE